MISVRHGVMDYRAWILTSFGNDDKISGRVLA